MVRNTSFHSWRHTEGLMNTAKIVVHEIQGQRVLMRFSTFFENPLVRRSKAAHRHPHCQILTLNIAGRNVLLVGLPNDWGSHCSNALRGAIARIFTLRFVPVQFDQHSVINFSPERQFHSSQIDSQSIRGQLDAVGQPSGQVVHEVLGIPSIARAHAPAGNQFSVRTNCGPRPHVTIAKLAAKFFRHILFLRIAELPNLIALDSPFASGKLAKRLVLILRTCLSDPCKQLENRVLCHTRLFSRWRGSNCPQRERLSLVFVVRLGGCSCIGSCITAQALSSLFLIRSSMPVRFPARRSFSPLYGEKPVTIAAGFNFDQGILLCADTKTTYPRCDETP